MASSSDEQKAKVTWDKASYFYRVVKAQHADSSPNVGERFLITDTEIKDITTPDEVHSFISSFPELGHGDVLSFSDYRAAMTYIVFHDDKTGQLNWMENPDDSGTGHLTIPLEILVNVRNAEEKYKKIIQHHYVNIHPSPRDRLIETKLGKEVPESWQFDLYYVDGEVEELYVTFPGKLGKLCSWDKFCRSQLDMMFDASGKEKAAFNIRVKLQGDSLCDYKNQHQPTGGSRMVWLAVKPSVPPGWEIEKGQSSSGPDHKSWIWKCTGPAEKEQQARSRIEEFLQEFPYEFLDSHESSLT